MNIQIKPVLLVVCLSLMLTACSERTNESSNAPESVSYSKESLQEPSIEAAETNPEAEIEVNYIRTELTVLKIAANHEEAESFAFSLELPEQMTVTYTWGEHDTSAPVVIGDDDWYMQAASISTGFDEEHLMTVAEEYGGTMEALELNGNKTILTVVPEEKYSAMEGGKKLADGYGYTYYILLDEETVLPLTFFSESENNHAKREFEQIVSSFEVL